jgi:hypothetical protein
MIHLTNQNNGSIQETKMIRSVLKKRYTLRDDGLHKSKKRSILKDLKERRIANKRTKGRNYDRKSKFAFF